MSSMAQEELQRTYEKMTEQQATINSLRQEGNKIWGKTGEVNQDSAASYKQTKEEVASEIVQESSVSNVSSSTNELCIILQSQF